MHVRVYTTLHTWNSSHLMPNRQTTLSATTHRHFHLNLAHGLVSLDDKVVVCKPIDSANLLWRALKVESGEWAGFALKLDLESKRQ